MMCLMKKESLEASLCKTRSAVGSILILFAGPEALLPHGQGRSPGILLGLG